MISELENAVFQANYRSGRQRTYRFLAVLTITVKQLLRGALIVWPGLFVLIAVLVIPETLFYNLMYLCLFLPAGFLWLRMIYRAVCSEYRQRVIGKLLDRNLIRQLLDH